MSRPDSLILGLDDLKKEINQLLMHCTLVLNKALEIESDSNYAADATTIEKDNVEVTIVPTLTAGKATLEALVW